jgi:ribonuclease P/MRP protein subunit POP1
MIQAINCRAALAQRAFQDVPRSLRRRSASHNVKRVPKPLREKATREMLADGTKPPKSVRGRKRLRMEKRRLQAKTPRADNAEEMLVDEPVEGRSIPKLKPRKVIKGKFAHRQGPYQQF